MKEIEEKHYLNFLLNGKSNNKEIHNKQNNYSDNLNKSTCDNIVYIDKRSTQNINFFRNAKELRFSYIDKLRLKGLFHETPIRKYNSIIIFDWDDTLLCSTYLTNNSLSSMQNRGKLQLSKTIKEKMQKLEICVFQVLQLAISYGDTYIITNASKEWVIFSIQIFYPKIKNLMKMVNIISAREFLEINFPKDEKSWKLWTFKLLGHSYDKNLVTNIISIGDSKIEMDAADALASNFINVYLKKIKFREESKIEHLVKQLNLVIAKFKELHAMVRNVTISVQKKMKN